MKKSALPILAALVLILGVVSYSQWNAARDATGALAGATAEREKLRLQVAAMEKRNRELQDEISTSREEAATVSTRSASKPMAFRSGGPGGMGGPMTAMDTPEMRRLMAIEQKGRLDARYAALFKSLGLAPQQLDKFKQLLVDKQNAFMDVMSAARSQGLTGPDSRSQIQALVQQSNNELNDSIKSLLGDSAYQQYQQFDKTQPQRSVVDQLANRLSYTDAPLTPQQSEQLVQLLASTAPTAGTGGGPGGAGNVAIRTTAAFATVGGDLGGPSPMISIMGGSSGAPITTDTVAQAQNVLNPTQLAALQQLQAEQQAQQQIGQVMRQSIESQGGTFRYSIPGTADGSSAAPPTPRPGG